MNYQQHMLVYTALIDSYTMLIPISDNQPKICVLPSKYNQSETLAVKQQLNKRKAVAGFPG
jgi:hypothetical protein